MAPRKARLEFFPHILKDSTTIRALEMLYGNDGYAVWFKLLEILGASDDYKYVAKTKAECDYLLEKFKIDNKKMKDIINTLCELNAIDKEMWKNQRTFHVPNLNANIQKMKRKVSTSTNLAEPVKVVDKKQYLEYVFLTESEYRKLVERFGERTTNEKIENLDNYVGQNPKDKKRQYDSHYRTILMWDSREKKEGIVKQKQPQYKDLSSRKIT